MTLSCFQIPEQDFNQSEHADGERTLRNSRTGIMSGLYQDEVPETARAALHVIFIMDRLSLR